MALFDPTERAITCDNNMSRQQQQQPQPRPTFLQQQQPQQFQPAKIEARLCIPPDQLKYLPKRARIQTDIPLTAIPRVGEAYYPVWNGDPWAVELVTRGWVSESLFRIEVWILNVRHSYPAHRRPPGFELTQ